MDVTFSVFSPEPALCHSQGFDDDILDNLSDEGLSLDFSPMDIGGDDGNDYISEYIKNVQLPIQNCSSPMDSEASYTVDGAEQAITETSNIDSIISDTTPDTTRDVKDKTATKCTRSKQKCSNKCSICGTALRKNSKCKKCSKRDLQYDSGVASGDDVKSATKKVKCKKGKCAQEETVNPRRSGRRKNMVDREYELRMSSLVNRVQVERRTTEPKQPKPKTKPPPLSKYRRKTANARERTRMNEINDAFEELKDHIPELPKGKLTKITTLRLALNYISEMRDMLGYKDDYSMEMLNVETGSSLVPDTPDVSPSLNLPPVSEASISSISVNSPTGSDSSGGYASVSDTNSSETGSINGEVTSSTIQGNIGSPPTLPPFNELFTPLSLSPF